MIYMQWIWLCCVFAHVVATLSGMILSWRWKKEFERVCPEVFNLSYLPWGDRRRAFQYWGYILSGKYKSLNNTEIMKKCAFLRIFMAVYTVNFLLIAIGIFALPHAT